MSKVLTLRGDRPPTLQEVLDEYNVDLDTFEVERQIVNKWQMARADKDTDISYEDGKATGHIKDTGNVNKVWLYQRKVWLRRRTPTEVGLRDMLDKLAKNSPMVKRLRRKRLPANDKRHMLEVSILDLHLGLQDSNWTPEVAEQAFLLSLERLLQLAKPYFVHKIVFPMGNDFLHTEWTGRTTKGTELEGHEEPMWTFERGKNLLITAIDRLKRVAPVHVIAIPGNHDRNAAVYMSHVIHAWYNNDPNVTVEYGNEPYRFVRYGKNLIGFEHGNGIPAKRLQALMPSERPQDWAETTYREWHLGDQHRKGTSKITAFEELGVGVEYLPSLVGADKWHRYKGFINHQRAAVAFLWNHEFGPVARFHAPFTV